LQAFTLDPYFDDAKFNLGAIYYLNGQLGQRFVLYNSCRNSQKKRRFSERDEVKGITDF